MFEVAGELKGGFDLSRKNSGAGAKLLDVSSRPLALFKTTSSKQDAAFDSIDGRLTTRKTGFLDNVDMSYVNKFELTLDMPRKKWDDSSRSDYVFELISGGDKKNYLRGLSTRSDRVNHVSPIITVCEPARPQLLDASTRANSKYVESPLSESLRFGLKQTVQSIMADHLGSSLIATGIKLYVDSSTGLLIIRLIVKAGRYLFRD